MVNTPALAIRETKRLVCRAFEINFYCLWVEGQSCEPSLGADEWGPAFLLNNDAIRVSCCVVHLYKVCSLLPQRGWRDLGSQTAGRPIRYVTSLRLDVQDAGGHPRQQTPTRLGPRRALRPQL